MFLSSSRTRVVCIKIIWFPATYTGCNGLGSGLGSNVERGFDGMGILCVFCVYDTIGNRCFEKTSFPKNRAWNVWMIQVVRLRKGKAEKSQKFLARVYAEVCIFCDRKTKYLKGNKSRQKLTQSVDLRADTTIREAATKKGDSKIMAIASRELVAAEAHYHISCYKRYTCIDTSREDIPLTERSSQSMDSSEYAKIESEAYSALFEFLRSDLFSNPRTMPMYVLTDHLTKTMEVMGAQGIKDSTKKHIKRKLMTEFGTCIEIITNVNGKLFVIPNNLSKATLVK